MNHTKALYLKYHGLLNRQLIKSASKFLLKALSNDTDSYLGPRDVTNEEITDEEITDEEITDEEITDEEITNEEITNGEPKFDIADKNYEFDVSLNNIGGAPYFPSKNLVSDKSLDIITLKMTDHLNIVALGYTSCPFPYQLL
jgi:hypothetical protein